MLADRKQISALERLVDDILLQILCALSITDILSLRCTSKRLSLVTYFRHIWHLKFVQHVVSSNLPIPGSSVPLTEIPSADLEWRTRRALHLQRTWNTLGPGTISKWDRVYIGPEAPVDQIVIMPGGVQMLVAQGGLVSCWDINSGSGVERTGEWVFTNGGTAGIVRDSSTPGVIAAGSSTRPGCSVTILSVDNSLKPVFRELCHYPAVTGLLVGLHDQFLVLDATAEEDGGIEVLNWKSKTSARLQYHPDIFGKFLDVLFFSSKILLFWENCISIAPIPSPTEITVLYTQISSFHEPITHPIALSTCHSRTVIDFESGETQHPAVPEALTIVGRAKLRQSKLSQSLLVPRRNPAPDDPFPYHLMLLSFSSLSCTTLRLGVSGRGVWVTQTHGGVAHVRYCAPSTLVTSDGMLHTPSLNMGVPICELDWELGPLEFDEGMGRLVASDSRGCISIIDLA